MDTVLLLNIQTLCLVKKYLFDQHLLTYLDNLQQDMKSTILTLHIYTEESQCEHGLTVTHT